MKFPLYEALDAHGLPFKRIARTIGELPSPDDRRSALTAATAAISSKIGIDAVSCIKFGTPVFTAFKKMNRPRSKNHAESKILLTLGCDVPLEFCSNLLVRPMSQT